MMKNIYPPLAVSQAVTCHLQIIVQMLEAGQGQTWRFRKKLLLFLWELCVIFVAAQGGTEMSLFEAQTKCRS